MKVVTVIFFSLFFWSCSADQKLMTQFEECYPKGKYQVLSNSIKKLDERVLASFPSNSIEESYRIYVNSWLDSGGKIENLFTQSEIEVLLTDFGEAGILSDFFMVNDSGYEQMNFWEDYFQCLERIEENRIRNYLDGLESSGDHLPMAMTITELAYQNNNDLEDLHLFILKTELIVNIIKARH